MQAIMEIFVQSNVDVDSQDNLDTGTTMLHLTPNSDCMIRIAA